MNEEARLEFAQLIQDYFLWAFLNPEDAERLSALPALQQPVKGKPTHSDLLGFSRWLTGEEK